MWVLRTRTYILTCVLLAGSLYLVAFTGVVSLFLVSFTAAYLASAVATFIYLGGLLFGSLPAELREFHSRRQLHYYGLLLIPLVVFVLATFFSVSVAPHQRGLPRILGLTGILAFSFFLLYNLITRARMKILVTGAVLFPIYFILVTAWASTMNKVTREPSREELAALPYIAWASTENSRDKEGVTVHRTDKASPGINLYAPNHRAEAFLADMNGKVLHQWVNPKDSETWAHVALNKNGDLLAIYKDRRLTRLSWNSDVIWRRKGRFHHDARFANNGGVYALSRNDEIVFHHFLPVPILNDYVVFLSPQGQTIKQYRLFDYLKKHVRPGMIFKIYRHLLQPKPLFRLLNAAIRRKPIIFSQKSPFDVFHTNSVELVESPHPLFREGDLLISMRNISLVAVLNPAKGEITWETNQLTMQHQPGLLANGNILVFDNGLPSTNSRIVEIDPKTKQLVWEYKASDFYAHNRGGTQRLPNGNTLITESPEGRAFEVTKDGETVWEFFTPQVRWNKRGVIYRVMRYSKSDDYLCLRNFFTSSDPPFRSVQ